MSDFDRMMQRRKDEMAKKRKKRKDTEAINDSDDLIAELIQKMKAAAEASFNPLWLSDELYHQTS